MINENPKKSNDKRKREGAEKVGQSGIGTKSLPLIVISFFSLNPPHFQIFYPTSQNQAGKFIYQFFSVQVTVMTVFVVIRLKS